MPGRIKLIAIAVMALLFIGFSSAFQEERPLYAWTRTASLDTARHDACAVAIAGNRILVTGGVGPGGEEVSSAEIYQADERFQNAPPMEVARSHAACVALSDGRVLVAGGRSGGRAIGAAEIFNPADETWTAAANIALPRSGHTATLLRDGRVLLVGGESDSSISDDVELFDPESTRFETLRTNLTARRKHHTAVLVDDGWVLIVGGEDGTRTLASSDFFDPLERTILAGPELPGPRARHTATVLLDGRVLVTGGTNGQDDIASTLLFNNVELVWMEGPQLQFGRQSHAALRIPNNGNVLIVGGSAKGAPIASSELYRVDGEIEEVGALTLARLGLVMAAREDGVVLAAGGEISGNAIPGCGNFIPPTIVLSRARVVRGQGLEVTGQNWPASQQGQIGFHAAQTLSLNTPLQFSSTGTFSRTHNSLASPGQVITVRVSSGAFVAETTFRIIARTTTLLTVSPPSGTTYGNIVTLRAEVRPEEVNGQMAGVIVFQRLIQAAPPPAPSVPTTFFVMSSFAPTPGTFSRNVSEFGFFNLPLVLPGGLYSFVALYPENDFYAGSTSTPVNNFPVGRASTSLSLTTSPDSPTAGNSTNVTATALAVPGQNVLRPTGRVAFTQTGLNVTASAFLDSGSPPRAVLPLALAAGSTTITAQYEGNTNYLPATASVTKSVTKGTIPLSPSTTTCIVFTPCQIKIQLNTSPSATGQVTLLPNPPNDPIGGSANLSPGGADFSLFFTATGSVTRIFNYSGDSNYHPNSLTTSIVTQRIQVPLLVLNATLQEMPQTLTVARNTDLTFIAALGTAAIPVGAPAATGVGRLADGISATVVTPMANITTALGTVRGVQITRRFTSPGTFRLVFSYDGDQFYLPASATRTLIVN